MEQYPDSQTALVQITADLLRLNNELGIDPMAFSNTLMESHGFTADQWSEVID